MPARMLGPEGRWIVRSHIDWVWKPLPNGEVLKTLRGKRERESPNWTIFASSGFGLLHYICKYIKSRFTKLVRF